MCLKAYEAYSQYLDFDRCLVLAHSHISAGECFKGHGEAEGLPRPYRIKRRPDLDELALEHSNDEQAVFLGRTP